MSNFSQKLNQELSKNTCLINNFIKQDISLNNKNWFKTGGNAQFFCEPKNIIDFQQALEFSLNYNLPVFLLGHGANILISDTGFDGLVISPKLTNIERIKFDNTHDLIKVGSGLSFQKLIDCCLENNLIGLEEFSGIPGTVGGSVFINIHYFEYLLSQFLLSAQVIDKFGKIVSVDNSWFDFGYNHSKLHNKEYYLVNATFKLKKANTQETAYACGKRDQIIRHRSKRYPVNGTCGSFFRNFFDHEVKLTSAGKKLIYVAYYLDKIGIKGELAVGDAIVSYQHANMIVNQNKATTTDIINLAIKMQELVYDKFGILPQPECRLVGFKEYPLLTL